MSYPVIQAHAKDGDELHTSWFVCVCNYLTCFTISPLLRTVVGFNGKQRSMGLSAKNQMVMNFRNTIWGFKTLVGRKFSDPYVQNEIKQFPYEVVEQPNDGIGIKVGAF